MWSERAGESPAPRVSPFSRMSGAGEGRIGSGGAGGAGISTGIGKGIGATAAVPATSAAAAAAAAGAAAERYTAGEARGGAGGGAGRGRGRGVPLSVEAGVVPVGAGVGGEMGARADGRGSPRWAVGAAIAGRLEEMRARELGASLRAKVQENEAMKRYVDSVKVRVGHVDRSCNGYHRVPGKVYKMYQPGISL